VCSSTLRIDSPTKARRGTDAPFGALYVLATRGRECNRLYVDTMYDPDVATSHEPPEELTPADVLRNVLANSGADKGGTHDHRGMGEQPQPRQALGRRHHCPARQ